MQDNEIFEMLQKEAKKIVGNWKVSDNIFFGSVASALMTSNGNIYTGICSDMFCGLGVCAERAAMFEMLKNRETHITHIVALTEDKILAPCGVCREFINQIDSKNMECKILLPDGIKTLQDIFPYNWQE